MAIMGVTVKKCHMIMSGNDCWNSVCFSCYRKADNELVDGSLVSACQYGHSVDLICTNVDLSAEQAGSVIIDSLFNLVSFRQVSLLFPYMAVCRI